MLGERFSAEDDEMLVELVSRHPMLWNVAHSEWKNQLAKALTWKEIGKQTGKTDVQCKIRWKSIRDHYKKQGKKEKDMPTGSAATKKRAAYWDLLRFLEGVEDERLTFSNATTQDTDLDDQDSQNHSAASSQPPSQTPEATTALPTPQRSSARFVPEDSDTSRRLPIKKAKFSRDNSVLKKLVAKRRKERQHLRNCLDGVIQKESEDEHDLFFRSMAQTVKKFRPHLITQAKKKIFEIVMNLEEENRQESHDHQNFTKYYPNIEYFESSSASSSAQSTHI